MKQLTTDLLPKYKEPLPNPPLAKGREFIFLASPLTKRGLRGVNSTVARGLTIIFGVVVLTGGLSSCSASYQASEPMEPLPANSAPTSTVSQSESNFASLEQSIYGQVNQYRQSHKLPPLRLDNRISTQARVHSEAMASGRVPFSHNGFEERVKLISRSISYRAAAENVAYNQGYSDPVKQAVQGWIKSPGHRENMEGNYDLTGIGVSKNAKGEYYFTQIFIRRG